MRSRVINFSLFVLIVALTGCATSTQEHPYGPDYLEPSPKNNPQINLHYNS